ncbi:class I SAM-dependent methyltransferase [Nocardia terpenica]|uniref:Methyltransferase domain-containing protein n=1 Tax=Nocardia terpenica TaxID=455432 RepID=A0A164LYB0_9NOCA|nr:methyltransferase domain-containing protein [Nocardia terpenica]KZM72860.1 hypothetical protein AWN90_29300 [Nocardia terpenica]
MIATKSSSSGRSFTRGTGRRMFLLEAFRDFRTTGAVAPSSRALAWALTEPVRASRQPVTVLEVGAGTGPITRELLTLLGPDDQLDVVEANACFVERLRGLVGAHADADDRIRVLHKRAEEIPGECCYDAIISGLPFTNFPPAQVDTIMSRYLELLRPGGALTYFAYRGTSVARRLVSSRAETARHREVERILDDYQNRYGTGVVTVWGNLPPAWARSLRRPGDSPVPPRFSAAHREE